MCSSDLQRARARSERLPDGTGEPDQSAVLVNRPVILESIRLTVNGETWQRIDDLAAAAPEVAGGEAAAVANGSAEPGTSPKVFTLDRESGEIRFGNGIHGARPPEGAVIQAAYAYGGGDEGVVGIGSISKAPPGLKVTNPIPTYGGGRAETVAEAEQRIPGFIRHRDRLVSEQDFRDIVWRTPGVELGRVEILPLFHPDQPAQSSAGVVTVMVVPKTDPVQPEAPVPDRLFLETICEYLAPRRLLTTELHLRGPSYVDIWISIGIEAVPGREQGPVREAVRLAIQRFVSPLVGGFEDAGWPLGKAMEAVEISAAATRVAGVAQVTAIHLAGPDGAETSRVEMSGLRLPRLRSVAVSSDTPPTIEQLRGEVSGPEPVENARLVPVPVVPETC